MLTGRDWLLNLSRNPQAGPFDREAGNRNAGSIVDWQARKKGRIDGSLKTYDYKALYQIYNLKSTESANYWFVNYSKSSSHDELQKVAEQSQTLTTDYHVEFTIQGNDYGISSVFITFEVIRLVIEGVTKDYVISNPASTGANLPDATKYPGNFTPVT